MNKNKQKRKIYIVFWLILQFFAVSMGFLFLWMFIQSNKPYNYSYSIDKDIIDIFSDTKIFNEKFSKDYYPAENFTRGNFLFFTDRYEYSIVSFCQIIIPEHYFNSYTQLISLEYKTLYRLHPQYNDSFSLEFYEGLEKVYSIKNPNVAEFTKIYITYKLKYQDKRNIKIFWKRGIYNKGIVLKNINVHYVFPLIDIIQICILLFIYIIISTAVIYFSYRCTLVKKTYRNIEMDDY